LAAHPDSDAEEPVRVSSTRPAAVVVLAAGEGTRMKSATPKVLHTLGGRSLLAHVVTAARALEPEHLCVVVGHAREQVTAHLAKVDPAATAVVQEQQNGTGHAVRMALGTLPDLDGTLVVTAGDTPLLTPGTLAALVAAHTAQANAATVLSAELPEPTGYGRILRADDHLVSGIVEHKDATDAQRAVSEVNSGMYAFDARLLREALAKVTTDNVQGEEYLTDVVGILGDAGHRVGAVVAPDHREILGVNDRVQLAEARAVLNERVLAHWMRAGVTVVDPRTTWFDVTVTLEPDSTVHPNTRLHGRTSVARDAHVGPNCTLTDTSVGAGARVTDTTAEGAQIGPDAAVGPYTYLRPGTRLGRGAKAGAYVEIKASVVGDGSKVPHLSYVGDALIGVGSNIGAATVVVNYDGVAKHRTTIGDHVRIGSDTMLVAPVTVGDGAYTAAGSVITGDVPPGAMAVARGHQRNVDGWVERRRAGSPAAAAAARAREDVRGEDVRGSDVPHEDRPVRSAQANGEG
jgi:bifunctional UDP-N-acetylglucosamine pyrophosphorylase/glucosamine-1-phosphate N-acetyltransferase